MLKRVVCTSVLGFVLVACGHGAGNAPADRSSSVTTHAHPTEDPRLKFNPFAKPDSDQLIRYSGRVESAPVSGDTGGTISAAQAQAAAAGNGIDDALQPGSPSATLRSVRIGNLYADPQPIPHLAWILTWRGSRPDTGGAVNQTHRPISAPAGHSSCIFVEIVNARTATVEQLTQIC